MSTSYEILEATRKLFRPVPSDYLSNVCYLCLGAVESVFDQCYYCRKLFLESVCPVSLRRRVVPMSVALNPSAWYWALQTYKAAQFPEHASTLGALTYRWLTEHEQEVTALLGGEPDYVTIVPSKKRGIDYATQPLRRALATVTPMGERLREVLRCANPSTERLKEYAPEIFDPVCDVRGDRIILIEDTWITGSTALSAAGALLNGGAASVIITPIAREMKPAYHGEEHPYLRHVASDYDITAWPRRELPS
jgi:hypothetical protein